MSAEPLEGADPAGACPMRAPVTVSPCAPARGTVTGPDLARGTVTGPDLLARGRVMGPESPQTAILRAAAHRCVDELVEAALVSDTDVTWPSWRLGADGTAAGVSAGATDLYGGDAGVIWGLQRLGAALLRPDATALARRGAAGVQARTGSLPAGLLAGRAGVDLAAGHRGAHPGQQWAPAAGAQGPSDLSAGCAGELLVLARAGDEDMQGPAGRLVARLHDRSRPALWGRCWADDDGLGGEPTPLLGLAHGASGVVLALVEAAWSWPALADRALTLADDGLAWEATWADPLRGGWPDLRDTEPSWPALWCHGAAGAGLVRLRILELMDKGLSTPWPRDLVQAEAESAVQACAELLHDLTQDALAAAQDASQCGAGPGPEHRHPPPGLERGWTLCHGPAGPAATLAMAARVWGPVAAPHLRTARDAAAQCLQALPEDPTRWPCGLRGTDGDLSLFNGLTGTALSLASLSADPGADPLAEHALLG
jgi:Lanthionine synthetase C-like protein